MSAGAKTTGRTRWRVTMLASVVAALACAPVERYEMFVPTAPVGGEAARRVFAVAYARQVTPEDNFVLRPDEFGGVTVDPTRQRLYVGTRAGTLLALDEADGKVAWEKDLGAAVSNLPRIIEDTTLLVGTDDGALLAIDLDSRETVWTHETDGTIRSPPVVGEGVVYFTNSRNVVYAVDSRTGAWRWEYEREIPKEFTIYGRAGLTFQSAADGASSEVGVLYTGFDDGRVVAIDAAAGEALWVTNLAPPAGGEFTDVDSTPLLDLGRRELVVAGQTTGVHGLALEDGSVRWQHGVRAPGSVVRGPGSLLVFASSLEGVFGIEPGGHLRWRQQVDPGVISTPIVVEGVAFVTHSEGGMLALDVRNGELLAQLETGSGMSSFPSFDPISRRLYGISNRGLLIALDVDRGL